LVGPAKILLQLSQLGNSRKRSLAKQKLKEVVLMLLLFTYVLRVTAEKLERLPKHPALCSSTLTFQKS